MRKPLETKLDPYWVETFLKQHGLKFTKIKGGRELLVQSPFYADKNPSLSLNPENGKFYCFWSGSKGNNFIGFYMHVTGKNFIESCNDLWVELERKWWIKYDSFSSRELRKRVEENMNKDKKEENNPREDIEQYSPELLEEPSPYMVERFHWKVKFLKKFNVQTLKKTWGAALPLLNKNLELKGYYFRNPKNSGLEKQLKFFWVTKRELLFNESNIQKDKPLIIVESPFDAILLSNYGYNVGALFGWRVYLERYKLINNLSNRILYWFDNDSSGQNGLKELYSYFKNNPTPNVIKYLISDKDALEIFDEQEIKNLLKESHNLLSYGFS